MRKSQSTTINIFFTFTFLYRKIFVRKHILKNLVFIVRLVVQFFHVASYWKCSNKTPLPIQTCIGLAGIIFRPKILGNRLGILTKILTSVDYYYFFIYISKKYLQFRKKQKHLLKKLLGSHHTRNWIYSLQNCFPNYAYLKHMYITLTGIGKWCCMVWRILLICQFLNLTAVFAKTNI